MKKIIIALLLSVSMYYVQAQWNELDDYAIVTYGDSTAGHYTSDICSYRWDTLYLRTSRYSNVHLTDTALISLRTPEFPKFRMPVQGKVISEFGWRGRRIHTGIDIKLNKGDSVFCSFDGIVRISRYFSGYGNIVVVRHFNGIETVYAHLSKRLVNVNDTVSAGQVLGLGGRTGRATTEHLHFETRYKEQPFNPRLIINFDTHELHNDTLLLTDQCFKFNKYTRSLKQTNSKSINSSVHIVQKGDTLYSIARRYGTTVKDLCALNGISENNILSIGQKIRIR
ncbi:MAG: M23 family metallopeptidase [Bacteroidales bacterium]|nr:M23 family metallopeptidase [Bacteroidales bacterium]